MAAPQSTGTEFSNGSLEGLPFIVTHWLANFEGGSNLESDEQRRAVERIRNASAEIASAFSSLGAFGSTIRPSFSASLTHEIAPQNATYSDVRRRWNGITPLHLETIAQAVAATNAVVETTAITQPNLLRAVHELAVERSATSGGRTVQDAITVDEGASNDQDATPVVTALSILQPPSLVTSTNASNMKADLSNIQAEGPTTPAPTLQARSSYVELGQATAEAMRKLLETRERVQSTQLEINGLQASISGQRATVEALNEKYRRLADEGADMTRMLEVSDEANAGKSECDRVTAQLERKLLDLTSRLKTDEGELERLSQEVKTLDIRRKGIVRSSQDPYWSWPGKIAPNSRMGANTILQTVIGRQLGLSRPLNAAMPPRSSILHGPRESHFIATRKALLSTRLSHAATINTHLGYPVYCLRFDRTGRYFISGADDYLIKVFHLGSGQSCRNKNPNGGRVLRCNYGANLRGAVLVCSLRGHAGVINDIDVSSDNAFLATASVDGDVRVWGLKDGCPIAILRGHKGGANMVSWSKLTPYRLISTGSDGFARMWDVREACLKRYGVHVGKRPEYRLNLTEAEKKGVEQGDAEPSSNNQAAAPLPPLPVRGALPTGAAPSAETVADSSLGRGGDPAAPIEPASAVVVPPLPAGVPPLPGDVAPNGAAAVPNANPQGEIAASGQFVANDEIDEGVKLLFKYKHGPTGPDVVGPGTRARRTAVNVICVARCPLGLYFATGSDDGICRVFEDEEDVGVAIVDQRGKCNSSSNVRGSRARSSGSRSADEPVLKLMGHVSAITDLSYSNAGDRLLSASQKDGVVRIWSLGKPALQRKGESGVSQIVLKLTDPGSRARNQPQASRRTHGVSTRSDPSKVSCDVAVWSHDDSKIITSQSVLVKQSGTDIQPGSQYLFLWESRTGQCLLGISGAHTMQCPVVVPHPTDSSLVCTAGADGIAKLWDWESGRCLFTHSNKVEFGPVEPADRDKLAGFLDGAFNPEGTTLVLTDDSGRLTILDSSLVDDLDPNSNMSRVWMREQYFANDYYDLHYDRNGYCIERGSERPPHLAPRGVRCNHAGTPWPDEINEAFSKVLGPSPLPGHISQWRRAEIRAKAEAALGYETTFAERQTVRVRRGVREFDPLSTILIKASGHVEDRAKPHSRVSNPSQADEPEANNAERQSPRNSSTRVMSANYRYLDYDDMMRLQGNQDDDEVDSDDEEFSPTARNLSGRMPNSDDDSEDDMELDDIDNESSAPSNRQRGGLEERQQRARRRAQRRESPFVELGSDDENDVQFVSTNNTPSGPFFADYEHHYWRMPNTGHTHSKWLKRIESDSSYEGRKIYTPQLGDSIVYIPRAHYETLEMFPSLEVPWQQFPQNTAWPVVRCCIRGVRFRFPYQDYFRASGSRCNSIVAILTLEVTGIPELSDNREFPWPKPSFIEPTRAFVFELSLFQSEKCEFIFPEGLYAERLHALESALRERNAVAGLRVSAYYDSDGAPEDAPMVASPCEIVTFQSEEDPASNPHLTGSGFGVLRVNFNDDSHWEEDFSPWDLCMADLSISRPHLSNEDKKLVSKHIYAQTRKDKVAELFNNPVDTVRYCDYDRMVEVEMNLMQVKRRLRDDYYASKFSVIQDLRLIRDNCAKYNGVEHELVGIAKALCDEVEAAILTQEEISFLNESDALMLSRNEQAETRRAPTIRISLPQRTNRVSATSRTQIQDSTSSHMRDRLRRQSSLENLPAPGASSFRATQRGRTQAAASGRRTRSMDPVANQEEPPNQRRSSRARGPTANLESLSRLDARAREVRSVEDSGVDNGLPQRATRYPTRRGGAGATQGTGDGGGFQSVNEPDPLASRRRTRSARQSAAEQDPEPGDETQLPLQSTRLSRRSNLRLQSESEPEEDEAQATVQSTGARRKPRRSNDRHHSESEEASSNENAAGESDQESEASVDDGGQSDSGDSDASPPARNPRRAAAERPATRSSPRARRPISRAEEPSRKSSRASARQRTSYEEPSDFEPDEDEMEEDESEEEAANPRNRARQVKSYAELPSDFEDEEDFSGDEGTSRRKTKRKRQASPAKKQAKKKKPPLIQTPNLKAWPMIDLQAITEVSMSMIEAVANEDRDGFFQVPVLETYPDIAESYLTSVEAPMDLRTIREERIPQYRHIKELQEDLILIFKNCCAFNGAKSDMGQYALGIWVRLNDLFAQVCEDLGVELRRWRP